MSTERRAPAEINGAELLDRVRAAVTRYVILPSDAATDAFVLWVAATHGLKFWTHATRMVIRAPEKRCGKSRLLDVGEALSWKPLVTVNASPSAIYRSIGDVDEDAPTILIDEADTIFGPNAQGANEDLRGLLNAGFGRGRAALRYDAATRQVEEIPTFAMAGMAGIGTMPDTIEDRAIVIRMRRRGPGEKVAPYRAKRDGPPLGRLRAELNRWVRSHPELEHAEPVMPVEDRAADTWEPLIAIADLAGGDWPERARAACLALEAEKEANTDMPIQVRLLIDIRAAFEDDEALATSTLLMRLTSDDEAPWAAYGNRGDAITPMQLGRLLREYDIRPGNIRFPNGIQAKGYTREAFADAWSRYCPEVLAESGQDVEADGPATAWPEQPQTFLHPSLGRLEPSHGTDRDESTPPLTSGGTAGTAGTPLTGTPTSPAVCIHCRKPLSYDDGSHTHPACA
ncbi:DUF3631 domain-containing protein [Kineosporia sp. NBRC 101731]|uniref:DUF3631 domain-containing protein n=1 Tax=Kineosporia sp. NBRC 101731 TaxID=3032199 RepID=UPI0024A4B60C|nr:DUF3631 domain-containing protein [Kineosporia sp. NBRC 101731]GLY26828.1 hypothetical protein Kisp02_01930 [Kineosporia sp. NBRC 101731]